MNTHLQRPLTDRALCGLDNWETVLGFPFEFTTDPYLTTCPNCRAYYEMNTIGYWMSKIGYVPPSARYSVVDTGIPGMFMTLLRS